MRLFDLPPKEKRKPSKHFWQEGNAEPKDWVHEPDYYICYRVGHDLRLVSIFFGIIIFSICCLYKYAGLFPWFLDYPHRGNVLGEYLHFVNVVPAYASQNVIYPEGKSVLQLYVYLINGTGSLFFLFLVYYGMLYRKNIRFDQYNILRQQSGSYKNMPTLGKIMLPFVMFIALFICLFPGSVSAMFYMKSARVALEGEYDSMLLVTFLSVIIAMFHSVFAQAFFKTLIISLYIGHEVSTVKEDD